MPKISARKGMYRIAKWEMKLAASATSSQGLTHGGIVSSELSCSTHGGACSVTFVGRASSFQAAKMRRQRPGL